MEFNDENNRYYMHYNMIYTCNTYRMHLLMLYCRHANNDHELFIALIFLTLITAVLTN